jgi:hypothetical protein
LPGPSASPTDPATGSTGAFTGAPANITEPADAPAPGDVATTVALCQTWMDSKRDKAVHDEVAQQLRLLMATADGPNGIPAFCRKLLDTTSAASSAPAAASPGEPTAKNPANTAKKTAPAPVTVATKNAKKSTNDK